MNKETEHYSNILLVSNDGIPLATISKKKYDWYIKKNLGHDCASVDGYKCVLQLNFTPKKVSTHKTLISVKENKCVISGLTDKLTLHHVIPYCVKKHFPLEEKEHTNQWCVLLNEEIHRNVEIKTREVYQLYLDGFQWEQQHKKLKDKTLKNECQRKWMLRHIDDLGGVSATKIFYKQLFMKMKPKFLPEGFLEDID